MPTRSQGSGYMSSGSGDTKFSENWLQIFRLPHYSHRHIPSMKSQSLRQKNTREQRRQLRRTRPGSPCAYEIKIIKNTKQAKKRETKKKERWPMNLTRFPLSRGIISFKNCHRRRSQRKMETVSYTHLTLPTKRIV